MMIIMWIKLHYAWRMTFHYACSEYVGHKHGNVTVVAGLNRNQDTPLKDFIHVSVINLNNLMYELLMPT